MFRSVFFCVVNVLQLRRVVYCILSLWDSDLLKTWGSWLSYGMWDGYFSVPLGGGTRRTRPSTGLGRLSTALWKTASHFPHAPAKIPSICFRSCQWKHQLLAGMVQSVFLGWECASRHPPSNSLFSWLNSSCCNFMGLEASALKAPGDA